MKTEAEKYEAFRHEVGKDVLRSVGFTFLGIPAIVAGFVFLGVWGWAVLAVMMYIFFHERKHRE